MYFMLTVTLEAGMIAFQMRKLRKVKKLAPSHIFWQSRAWNAACVRSAM